MDLTPEEEIQLENDKKNHTSVEQPPYINQRRNAYPSIQEQLDMQYWDNVNGTTNWEDAIAKVKADYPKS